MRISDWSSDVCSSDLSKDVFAAWSADCQAARSRVGGRASRPPARTRRYLSYSPTHSRSYRVSTARRSPSGMHRYSIRTSRAGRSEEHTSELQSLMRISYAVFCLKKKKNNRDNNITKILDKNAINYNIH